MASKVLRVIIEGDVKGALAGFAEVEAGSGGLESKLTNLGTVGTVAGIAAAAGVAAIGIELFKVGEDFESAYHKIETGTGATGEALAGLKDQFKQVVSDIPTDFGKAADAVTKLTSKLGLEAGPISKQVTEQLLELSRITKTDLTTNIDGASAALLSFNVPITDYSSKLDEVFRASQQSGVAFADITSQMAGAGAQLRAVGFDFDQSTALLATLGRVGIDVSDVLPALSKSMAVAGKEGKSAGDLFKETFAAIKNAPDDIVASGDALAVFGAKAGPKFAQLIREGKLDFDGFMASIQGGTGTILEAGKNAMSFGDKWELIKNRVFVALEPLAMKMVDGIGKAMDRLGPYVQQFGVWFNENLPKWMAAITPAAEAFGVALVAVGSFIATTVIPALVTLGAWVIEHKPILEGLAVAVGVLLVAAFVSWAVSAAAAAAATLAAAAPVILITAALAALVAGIIYAYENWDWFRTAVDAVASFLTDVLWPALQSGIAGLVSSAEWLSSAMQTAWSAISAAISFAWDNIISPYFTLIDYQINFLVTGFGVLEGAWSSAWDAMGSALQWVWDNVIGPIVDTIMSAINGVQSAFNGIKDIAGGGGSILGAAFGPAGAGLGALGIPGFDTGGPVLGPVGAPQLAVVHGGEYVLTADQARGRGGGSSTTLNLTVNAGMGADGNRIGQQVVEAIRAYERSNGTGWRN